MGPSRSFARQLSTAKSCWFCNKRDTIVEVLSEADLVLRTTPFLELAGKTLAYTRVELQDAESGKLLAYGTCSVQLFFSSQVWHVEQAEPRH